MGPGAALTSTLHWFETELLTREENLVGLMALNRDMLAQTELLDHIDRVVLDMDSSESPVHGQQEHSAYNGHFESVCYHPLFLCNGHGDCLAAKLRSGNVRSADDWDEPLLPEIERQQAAGTRVAFRADAAFAKPTIYEGMEERGVDYAIRVPANASLEWESADLLFRPPGRPSQKPLVRYKSFHYQAGSWTLPRRVVAKVEHHAGELFPRVGFIVTNLQLPSRAVVRFYNKRGTAEQWIKKGKQAAHWTRLSCHRFRANEVHLQLSVRLQPRESLAAARAPEAHRQLVPNQCAAAPGQDRRTLGETCAVLLAAAGRESSDQASVRGDPAADLGAAGPSELTVSEFSEERSRRKSTRMARCPRNAVEPRRFPSIPRRGVNRLSVSGCRTVSDEQTRRCRRAQCSICLFRAPKWKSQIRRRA
ncbi:hypothetical protein BH18ACI5_BH18ACI5_26440 [soil metagenome]